MMASREYLAGHLREIADYVAEGWSMGAVIEELDQMKEMAESLKAEEER